MLAAMPTRTGFDAGPDPDLLPQLCFSPNMGCLEARPGDQGFLRLANETALHRRLTATRTSSQSEAALSPQEDFQ